MCYGATCPTCSNQSWRGCGNHIPSAMAGVPEDKWCTCAPRVDIGGKEYPPQAKFQMPAAPSWMQRWVGGGAAEEKKEGL